MFSTIPKESHKCYIKRCKVEGEKKEAYVQYSSVHQSIRELKQNHSTAVKSNLFKTIH